MKNERSFVMYVLVFTDCDTWILLKTNEDPDKWVEFYPTFPLKTFSFGITIF